MHPANQRLRKPDKLSQGLHNQTNYPRVQWENTLDKREATEHQAFILCWELHQVWEQPSITAVICVAMELLRVAMVVMDKEDYITEVESLLSQPAYRVLPKDSTNQIKAKFITKLRSIKKDTNLEEGMYKAMYPTGCIPPKFYGLPKIHKTGNTLRPIVSSRGLVTYGVAKVLSKVLNP